MKIEQFPQTSSFQKNFARLRSFLHHGDRPWSGLILLMAGLVLVLIAVIALLLWNTSVNARAEFGLGFILPTEDARWNPVADKFQAWPFIYGTLITSLIAIVLSVPISLGVGIFLAELSPGWLRTPLTRLLELLAAIPSVIFGLWGIFIFLPMVVVPISTGMEAVLGQIPLIGSFFLGPVPANGSNRLAAGLILTIMVIPTISSVTRDVLMAVPNSQREAALALGATRWEMIWQVVLPYGLSGILGAVILGLGRALGETMAVTMVIGNSIQNSFSILRPGYTMASIIANEFAEAVTELHSESLIYVGLVLFILTLILNLLARLLVWRVARKVLTAEVRA